MVGIGLSTPVTITMGKLISVAVSVVVSGGVVLWTVLSFTVGGIRDDVGAIRQNINGLNVPAISQAITNLQTADRDNITRANEINTRLTEQIQGLRVDFVKYSDKFEMMSSKFDTVNKSIEGLTTRFDTVNKSIDNLNGRLDKLQEARVSSPPDPKQIQLFSDYLKKFGGDRVIVVPYETQTR